MRKPLVGLLLLCVLSAPCGAADRSARASRPWSIALFHGWFTDDGTLKQTLTFDAGIDSTFRFLGAALNRRVAGLGSYLDIESELQVVRHYAGQSHWEVNGLGVVRWLAFPWDALLDTQAAFGVGLSFASEKPEFEVFHRGASEQVLAYLLFEVELGLPQLPHWSLLTRVHHRSNAFDVITDDNVTSNAVALGLRYRF